mgnify:FL=1
MIQFQTITSFRGRLKALVEYKKGVYSGASDEIKSAFTNVSISQIRNNRDMILMQNDALLIKLRLPDHKNHLSRADGYRLIYLVSRISEKVVFLDIYPKRGPMQQLDISNNDLKRLLAEYIAEATAGVLEEYPI